MKFFISKLLLFLLPLVIIFSFVIIILTYIGEGYTVFDYNSFQKNHKLLGSVYNDKVYSEYKVSVLKSQPKFNVLALGSSRVLQFRTEMFKDSFFNAGYTVSSIFEFLPFLYTIPKPKYPKYLIIGLDQWMFNGQWDAFSQKNNETSWGFTDNSPKRMLSQFVSFMFDIFHNKYSISFIINNVNRKYIGLNALYNQSGIRSDGSFFYGKQTENLLVSAPETRDFKYSDTFSRINNGNKRFEYGEEVDPTSIIELNNFLDFCSKNNIIVIGFLPPFADAVYKKMELSGNYGYLKKIYPMVKPIFGKYQYEIYDFSNVSTVGSGDLETIDGFHGSDVTYQKILIEMLRNNSKLNKVADLTQLINDLNHAKNRYLVYPN